MPKTQYITTCSILNQQKMKLLIEESPSPSSVGNEGSDISKCHDEEGDCLDKEKDEEVVFPKHDIVAADKEEIHSNAKF